MLWNFGYLANISKQNVFAMSGNEWDISDGYKNRHREAYEPELYKAINGLYSHISKRCKYLSDKFERFNYLSGYDKNNVTEGDQVSVDKNSYTVINVEGNTYTCVDDDGNTHTFDRSRVLLLDKRIKKNLSSDCEYIFDDVYNSIEYKDASYMEYFVTFYEYFGIEDYKLFEYISARSKVALLREIGIYSIDDIPPESDDQTQLLKTIRSYFTSGMSNPIF